MHPLLSAVHWFLIAIPVSHVEDSLCNPPTIMHRREAGGVVFLFPEPSEFLDQKFPTHVLKSALLGDVCHMTVRFAERRKGIVSSAAL